MIPRWMPPALAAGVLAFSVGAFADPILMDFEGLANGESPAEFYNGGLGGSGSGPGPAFGVSFGPSALALIDLDAGGGGNFANEPSPDTILFFLDAPGAILNVPSGFTNAFSFYYSSINFTGVVRVYDAPDATGNVLATIPLAALGSDCPGDPNGGFSCWDAAGSVFFGTAYSVDFGDAASEVAFDGVGLGTEVIPEPSGWILVGSGLACLAVRRRIPCREVRTQ